MDAEVAELAERPAVKVDGACVRFGTIEPELVTRILRERLVEGDDEYPPVRHQAAQLYRPLEQYQRFSGAWRTRDQQVWTGKLDALALPLGPGDVLHAAPLLSAPHPTP